MGDGKKTISINDGSNGRRKYCFYDSYETYEEAMKMGKETKKKEKAKWFIVPAEEGWFLPIEKFNLYFDKEISTW